MKRARDDLPIRADLDALRGAEGAAASAWFLAFASSLRADAGMEFAGRERRPPPDPVNALLSFAGVLLTNRLAGQVEARGLDPAIGFLHEVRAGRASVALDLVEPFRHVVVDRFVLRACNLRILRPEHFEPDPDRPEGVHMTRAGLRAFFAEYERFLQRPLRGRDGEDRSVIRVLESEVDALAAALVAGAVFEPFRSR